MKIFNPQDLFDHTIVYEPQDKDELINYLNSNNIGFYEWNNGTLIVKKEHGKFIDNYICQLGYFEVHWHNDVKKIINCKPAAVLEKTLSVHNKAVDKLSTALNELNDLKNGLLAS